MNSGNSRENSFRLAIVVSHPIQHFAPQYRSLAQMQDVSLKVFFASHAGAVPYQDADFGQQVDWGSELLEGFNYVFLNDDVEQPLKIDAKIDAKDLKEHLDRFSPDAVLCYGHGQKLQRRARRWAIRENRHLIYVADIEDRYVRRLREKFMVRLKLIRLRIYLRKFSLILSIGDANEDFYTRAGISKEKIVRTSFPIDVGLYQAARQLHTRTGNKFRSTYAISLDSFVFLTVGKLIPLKRHQDLIQGLALINDASQVTLVIAGSGSEENSLRLLVHNLGLDQRVVFTGFVEPDLLPSIYLGSDCYVHISERDHHPLAVSEAISCGLPVIVSDNIGSWGPTDDVQPGVNGWVVDCRQLSSLADAMNKMSLLSKSDRVHMGEKSFEISRKNQESAHGGWVREVVRRLENRL